MDKRNQELRRRDAGFTLIEILLVVVIIGMLAAVLGTKLTGKFGMAQKQTAKAGVAVVEQAISAYQMENGKLPESLQNLLDKGPMSGTPFLSKPENLKDPWGMDYQYTKQGDDFTVVSAGPDKSYGSADDIK